MTSPLTAREREAADAARWRGLVRLCGDVSNGTDTSVRLSQDDATGSWFVVVGRTRALGYFGSSPGEALDRALADQPEEET